MQLPRKYPYFTTALIIIGAGLIAASTQKVGDAVSDIIGELSICKNNISFCQLSFWVIILLLILGIGICLELLVRNKEKPNVIAGVLDQHGNILSELTIYLKQNNSKEDVAKVLNDRRNEIFEKNKDVLSQYYNLTPPIDNTIESTFTRLNIDHAKSFKDRVEEYLILYRIYMESLYAKSIFEDRYKQIGFAIKNNSTTPVYGVIIKLSIPNTFPFPQRYITGLMSGRTPPKPQEPEVLDLHQEYGFDDPRIYYHHNDEKTVTGGLRINYEYGKDVIRYDIEKLIPNLPDEDFPPFLMWLGDIEKSMKVIIRVEIFTEKPSSNRKYNIVVKIIVPTNQWK